MRTDPISEDEREYITQVKALEQVESAPEFAVRIVQKFVDQLRMLRFRRFTEALIRAISWDPRYLAYLPVSPGLPIDRKYTVRLPDERRPEGLLFVLELIERLTPRPDMTYRPGYASFFTRF